MKRRRFIQSAAAGAAALFDSPYRPALPLGLQAAHTRPTDRDRIFRHIDEHLAQHIEMIQAYLRQPSVSVSGEGIRECAELTRQYLAAAGCRDAHVVPTNGHPGVWGFLNAHAAKTLAIYWMYDVSPVSAEDWSTPPFDAVLVRDSRFGVSGRILRARGALDAKGCERAFLNAVESIIAVRGSLPVNLMFLCEGEEEIGSPNLSSLTRQFSESLRQSDGVLFPMARQQPDGTARVQLGGKGVVVLELTAHGGDHGGPRTRAVHSMAKSAIDSPAWRLVQALASLTDATGNQSRVGGFRDRIRPLTDRESELLDVLAAQIDQEAMRREYDVDRWIGNAGPREMIRRLLYEPSINLSGISSGGVGNAAVNVIPHQATARLDVRLVPSQRAAEVQQHVRAHLNRMGFSDIQLRTVAAYDSWQTAPDSTLALAAMESYRAFHITPVVWPMYPGATPFALFTRDLALPVLSFGIGYGGNIHGPDEFLVIDTEPPLRGLADIEKGYVDFLLRFGGD